jgi:hypothetical protein
MTFSIEEVCEEKSKKLNIVHAWISKLNQLLEDFEDDYATIEKAAPRIGDAILLLVDNERRVQFLRTECPVDPSPIIENFNSAFWEIKQNLKQAQNILNKNKNQISA